MNLMRIGRMRVILGYICVFIHHGGGFIGDKSVEVSNIDRVVTSLIGENTNQAATRVAAEAVVYYSIACK